MTDLAGALVDTSGLGEFEGDDVLRVGIEIPAAAGGLREAMKFAPVVLHRGDEVVVALRCTVSKVRFDPIKDVEDAVARVQILDTSEAIFVDEETLAEAFKVQRDKIEAAKIEAEKAAGVNRLPMDGEPGGGDSDEDDAEFVHARNHAAGVHRDNPNPDCPACKVDGSIPDGTKEKAEPDATEAPIPMSRSRSRKAKDKSADEE